MGIKYDFVNYYDDNPLTECKTLRVTFSEADKTVDFINSNNIRHLFIGKDVNDSQDIIDLKFLLLCPNITRLGIKGKMLNTSVLDHLKYLEWLFIDNSMKYEIIDLTKLHSLSLLSIYEYSKNIIGIEALENLKCLKLWNYSSKNKNICNFNKMANLKDLFLIAPKIDSLEGIDKIQKLEKLQILNAKKLKTINHLKFCNSPISFIEIQNCPLLTDFSSIIHFKSLQKVILIKCGRFDSKELSEHLPNVELIISNS